MKQNAFTLIELLGVIIILAIILVITVPIVYGIIENSNKQAKRFSAQTYVKQINVSLQSDKFDSNFFESSDLHNCYDVEIINNYLEVDGDMPDQGLVCLNEYNDLVVSASLNIDEVKSYYTLETGVEVIEDEYFLTNIDQLSAVWFWCNAEIPNEIQYVDNPEKTIEVLDILQRLKYNVIFIPMSYSEVSRYENFINEASRRNIAVYSLEGDFRFILPSSYQSAIYDLVDNIKSYNDLVGYSKKVKGVHYDVEFYTNAGDNMGISDEYKFIDGQSEAAKNGIRRELFIQFINLSSSYAHENNLKIGFDLPVWINRYSYYDNGIDKPIIDDIIKNLDHVAIMNYTTNHNNMYNGLTWTGEFHHGIDPPEITIMVSEPIIDTLNRYQVVYLNGYELPVFEAEYNAKLSNPSLVPTYIAADYEYTYEYISWMMSELEEDLNQYHETQNFDIDFGFCTHHIYNLLELIAE